MKLDGALTEVGASILKQDYFIVLKKAMEEEFLTELEKELEENGDLERNLCLKGSCAVRGGKNNGNKGSSKGQTGGLPPGKPQGGGKVEPNKRYTIDANGVRELMPNEIPLSSPIFVADQGGKLVQEKSKRVDLNEARRGVEKANLANLASLLKDGGWSKPSKALDDAKEKKDGSGNEGKVQYRKKSRKRRSSG